MEVILQLLIAFVTIGLVTGSHYFWLQQLRAWMDNTRLSPLLTLLGVVYGITISQLTAALLFCN
tara:strand:- start:875 stop:1066 length:192 start_codon:yes stop_codon:yes gene_type:complete